MAEKPEIEIVYECPGCYQIIPYLSCFHSCPGLYNWRRTQDEEDQAFQEHLGDFYKEVMEKRRSGVEYWVVGADGEEYLMSNAVVLAVPDQPGHQYQESIDIDGRSHHLLRQNEVVPLDVQPIQMVQVSEEYYRTLTDLERREMDTRFARLSVEERLELMSLDQPPADQLLNQAREPYP